jgi:RNA polymerase sigma factor (sigma-70 family)
LTAALPGTITVTGVDEARWVEYYVALEKPLYNVVYRWVWDAAESQDIVQEAFLRCWRIRRRIRDDGFRSLVFRTALRLASNQRRRRRLWRMVSFGEAEETLPCAAHTEPIPKPVREAIDRLPESLKRVLLLSELAGMTYREIADVMKIKEGTVGSRRNRAIAILRRRLEAHGVHWDEC